MRTCRMQSSLTSSYVFFGLLILTFIPGCDRGPQVSPVSGIVYYNDEPLPFGGVMFQPSSGQPAGGRIEADGSFRLSTFSEFDGAIVGSHKVKITCYSSQSPRRLQNSRGGEQTLGASLIPENYTLADQSGLTAEVEAGENNSFEFRLSGPDLQIPE